MGGQQGGGGGGRGQGGIPVQQGPPMFVPYGGPQGIPMGSYPGVGGAGRGMPQGMHPGNYMQAQMAMAAQAQMLQQQGMRVGPPPGGVGGVPGVGGGLPIGGGGGGGGDGAPPAVAPTPVRERKPIKIFNPSTKAEIKIEKSEEVIKAEAEAKKRKEEADKKAAEEKEKLLEAAQKQQQQQQQQQQQRQQVAIDPPVNRTIREGKFDALVFDDSSKGTDVFAMDAPHVPPAATTVDDRLAYERKGHVCIRDVLTDDEARNMSIELVKVILFLSTLIYSRTGNFTDVVFYLFTGNQTPNVAGV